MEKNQVSHTALSTAYIRAYHAKHDFPKIIDDFLAHQLLPDDTYATIEEQFARSVHYLDPERAITCPDQAAALAWSMQSMAIVPITLARSRYAEDMLTEKVRQGLMQYVILGAGMDTFAFRRPYLLELLQVFEIDHPATQSFKRNRLTDLGWNVPEQLHFLPANFTQKNLTEVLADSAYNPQAAACFNWLGVTMFLTRDAVVGTLRAIADLAPAGSSVIFDYMDTDVFVTGRTPKRVQFLMESVRRLGEPVICGFNPLTLDRDLANLGFHLEENLTPSDIQERYFQKRSDRYYATENAYIAHAVVKK
ncbi:MAG: putative S-adenosyl-L-methionine-dependent methyltransferase [Pelotomaculum sp. PtaB.Bin104]|nr:MAG: putative S-adenosyl-L-methionine-dependent methyltransferase [Pelotomaculum sp. PtaB.Bin104]